MIVKLVAGDGAMKDKYKEELAASLLSYYKGKFIYDVGRTSKIYIGFGDKVQQAGTYK